MSGQKRKKKKRPPRKDAHKGEMTYADILRKIKIEPELKDVGQHVHGIKRTANGELLLILENGADPNTQKYCSIL